MNDFNDLIPPVAGLIIALSGYLFAKRMARLRKLELSKRAD